MACSPPVGFITMYSYILRGGGGLGFPLLLPVDFFEGVGSRAILVAAQCLESAECF